MAAWSRSSLWHPQGAMQPSAPTSRTSPARRIGQWTSPLPRGRPEKNPEKWPWSRPWRTKGAWGPVRGRWPGTESGYYHPETTAGDGPIPTRGQATKARAATREAARAAARVVARAAAAAAAREWGRHHTPPGRERRRPAAFSGSV